MTSKTCQKQRKQPKDQPRVVSCKYNGLFDELVSITMFSSSPGSNHIGLGQGGGGAFYNFTKE